MVFLEPGDLDMKNGVSPNLYFSHPTKSNGFLRKPAAQLMEKIDEFGQEVGEKNSQEQEEQSLIRISGINLHPTHRTRL